ILHMTWNLPNLLTWARILAIPLLVVVFYLPLGLSDEQRNLFTTVIFVVAAITDWVDGWLARKWNQTSPFGAFLDPVADKLMVCTALVALIDLGRLDPVIGLIIIGREITISALREWMASVGARSSVAVNWMGKAKTIAQMVAIPFLLYHGLLFGVIDTAWWGHILVWIAAILTVISMVVYLKAAWPELQKRS
ncbi:MAG: CDP-diacylglycerol--glycerol-3-phosphate 3-phosphatidyltransferase, partial [Pseudomonadota bacterium]